MIDILLFYLKLGFWHVIDLEGLDHFYFITTLVLPFTFKEGRKLVWWITLFTIGHTISLFGNFYAGIPFSSYWIELLIPLTIGLNAITSMIQKMNFKFFYRSYFFPFLTLIFGLIHGLGFGSYFNMLVLQDEITFSLISFALGVELAQIAIVIAVLFFSIIITKTLKVSKKKLVFLIAAMILSQALSMIFERI